MRTIVVTGGGSGIGRACVQVLARQGCRVIVADIDLASAEAVAHEANGHSLHMDVSSEGSIVDAAEYCEAHYGVVDGLVACAGILQQPYSPETMPMSVFDNVMNINLRGAYLTIVAFGRRMATRGSGSIVAIGSMTAMRSAPLHAYAPSKAAVVHMVQCLAAEWGRSGVRVNAVSPGYVSTPALLQQIELGLRDGDQLAQGAAAGRLVLPHEVAEAVAFLLGESASAITGVNLPVDAGWLVGSHAAGYGGVPRARAVA